METKKTSISYSDYASGIKYLNIDEQLALLGVISARLRKSIGKRRKKIALWSLRDWALTSGKALMHRIMFRRSEIHGISR
jgi:hypothetical protein